MPTGYTAELMEKGQSFKDFVLGCARSFGACITMRDEPHDAEIPEKFEPSDYHVKKISEAYDQLAILHSMREEEKISFGERKKSEEVQRYKKLIQEETEQNERLIEMRKKVTDWTPPTADHEELKKFMLQQISICIHDTAYFEKEKDKSLKTPPIKYYSNAVIRALNDIEYHTNENKKEIERVGSRNEWITQLRDSLN